MEVMFAGIGIGAVFLGFFGGIALIAWASR
jgi:hypothetical protein